MSTTVRMAKYTEVKVITVHDVMCLWLCGKVRCASCCGREGVLVLAMVEFSKSPKLSKSSLFPMGRGFGAKFVVG